MRAHVDLLRRVLDHGERRGLLALVRSGKGKDAPYRAPQLKNRPADYYTANAQTIAIFGRARHRLRSPPSSTGKKAQRFLAGVVVAATLVRTDPGVLV